MQKTVCSLIAPALLFLIVVTSPAGMLVPEARQLLVKSDTNTETGHDRVPWCDPFGITILLMGEDPDGRFEANLQQASRLGVRWVQVMFPAFQANHDSSTLPIRDRRSPSRTVVEQALLMARTAGFKVALHPILLIQDASDPHWRGQLVPVHRDQWFRDYQRWIVSWSQLATTCGVNLFFVGSELSSMQVDQQPWQRILRSVRSEFGGPITYSANWDAWTAIPFASHLDALGVNAYVPLSESADPRLEQLIQRFLPYRSQLLEWTRQTGVPVFFSEVGYPSHDRALETPWDQHRGNRVDMETQKSGYEAFIATFSGDQPIRGVFFYALHEDGGQADRGYTPAGKPTIEVLRRYFLDRSENSDGLRSRP
ncbi:MAG: hypothetical protein AAEJ65_01630 [Planctomycetota bacterium]